MKTYYVLNQDFDHLLSADQAEPYKKMIGMTVYEPEDDCEKLLRVDPHIQCSRINDEENLCPLLCGDSPCKSAIKCKLVYLEGKLPKKTTQRKLI